MATGPFTYNALRTKTLKERIKTQKKCKSFKLDKIRNDCLYARWAQFCSQGIVVKRTAAFFFLTVD